MINFKPDSDSVSLGSNPGSPAREKIPQINSLGRLLAAFFAKNVLQAVARQYRLISAPYRSLPFVRCNTRATPTEFFCLSNVLSL